MPIQRIIAPGQQGTAKESSKAAGVGGRGRGLLAEGGSQDPPASQKTHILQQGGTPLPSRNFGLDWLVVFNSS